MRRRLCALALSLCCVWPAWLSAQAGPSLIPTWLPGASPPLSAQLDELATRLEQALIDSATDWEILSWTLIDLSSRLDGLATSSRALERESESMRESLRSLDRSLAVSMALARRHSLVAGLLRVGALSGVLGVGGALALSSKGQGAAIGAGLGALAGAAWWAVENWPPRLAPYGASVRCPTPSRRAVIPSSAPAAVSCMATALVMSIK